MVVILIGLVIAANYFVKNEVKKVLDSEGSSSFTYEDISINLLSGNASVEKISFEQGNILIEADDVELQNFSYSDYISNSRSVVDRLIIQNPQITIRKQDTSATAKDDEKPFEEDIRIKSLQLNGGNLRFIENDTAGESFFLKLKEMRMAEVVLNRETLEESIPVRYENLNLESDSLFYAMDSEHDLYLSHLKMEGENLIIDGLKIQPKFSKAEFDRRVPYEKDRAVLEIQEVSIKDLHWQKEPENLILEIALVSINEADLSLYRNKLLPDDTRIKPLYSKSLRELEVKLSVDSVKVTNSKIVYEEKVLEDRPAGELNFTGVDATIVNISNINMDSENFQETKVEAEALFMGETPVNLNLRFDISEESDTFYVDGMLGEIRAAAINPFVKPAMGIETEGTIESLYYNFRGNDYEATGDMQLSYRDFKVSILKDGEEEEKSFLSGIVNLILKNDRVNEDVEQENIQVERDRTKSIWNFLWLAIREGALKTFL